MKSNLLRTLFAMIGIAGICFFIYSAYSDDTKAQSSPRDIPGVTSADMFPHACVSCHKNYPEQKMDVRLSTILKEWNDKIPPEILAKFQAAAPEGVTLKGKHPFKMDNQANVPEVCEKCHGKSMKSALPMDQIMHLIHLGGGKESKFVQMFQGDCTHCHKLDQKTWTWHVGNGKEADEEK